MSATELAERPTGEIQMNPANPIGQMLQAITAGGITTESAAALEKMTDLYLRVEAENARKAFAQAKAELQSRLPHVIATKPVPNNDGTVRYTFATYQSIMKAVEPYLSQHGFSISFSQEVDDKRITAICTLTHVGGHSESNRFAVRAGKGPPGSSESQADGSASTYAKRFALCNCLNVTVDMPDDDARLLGDVITKQQAAELQRRVEALGASAEAFLNLADSPSFAEIHATKYPVLVRSLEMKERARRTSLPPRGQNPGERMETSIPPSGHTTNQVAPDVGAQSVDEPDVSGADAEPPAQVSDLTEEEKFRIRAHELADASGVPHVKINADLDTMIRLHGGKTRRFDAVPEAMRRKFLDGIGK